MIKKILIYLSICTGFIFCFLFGKYINTLAVTNIENTLGSYPVQIDIDNYNRENLFYTNNNFNYRSFDYNYYYNNGNLSISYNSQASAEITTFITKNMGSTGYYIDTFTLTEDNSIYLESGTYNFSFVQNGTFSTSYFIVGDLGDNYSSADFKGVAFGNTTFTINEPKYFCFAIYSYQRNGYFDNVDTFSNIMLVKDNKKPDNYYSYFEFGFSVDLVINNPGNNSYDSVNGTLNINTKINNVSCYNSSYSISANIDLYKLNNICFIPFNVDSKGYISLNEINLNTTFTSSNISLFQGESGYILTPYLRGYYKGEYVENIIYLKNSYVSNSFYLNGFTARINGNNDEKLTSVSIRPYNNNEPGDETFGLTKDNQSFNFISELVSEVKFYNLININDNLNFQLGLTYGQFQKISEINTLNYVFSLSGINSIVINDISATSPLPNNPNTNNKYNICSAWYDIPCQLGNAVTYVIYEAPIISPVLMFIDTFITMFSSLVTFVDLFKSFGIVFGCFVIYMFIELLHKYSK